jgi:hypothetical protein
MPAEPLATRSACMQQAVKPCPESPYPSCKLRASQTYEKRHEENAFVPYCRHSPQPLHQCAAHARTRFIHQYAEIKPHTSMRPRKLQGLDPELVTRGVSHFQPPDDHRSNSPSAARWKFTESLLSSERPGIISRMLAISRSHFRGLYLFGHSNPAEWIQKLVQGHSWPLERWSHPIL